MDINEKLKVLKETSIKGIEKKFGQESYYLGEKKLPDVPTLCSTGSLSLDYALTIGGFPEGRVIEIGGKESSGKTTLTLINIAECQRQGKLCAFLDAEQAFDPIYASKLKVDVSKLLLLQPDTAEEGFEMIHEIIKSGVVSLIVIDSTNSMVPKRIFEGEVGDASMGRAALLFSQELPKVRTECTNNKCTAIFLSQLRKSMNQYEQDKMGVGEAMKYYASVRIKTSKAELIKDDGEDGQSSVDVVMNIFKNKVGIPFKRAQFTLLTGQDGKFGIDKDKEILDYSIKFDIIKKSGSWYSYGEERIGQGEKSVKAYFENKPEIFEQIKSIIVSKFEEEKRKSLVFSSFDSTLAEAVENNVSKKRKRKDESETEEIAIEIKAEEVKE